MEQKTKIPRKDVFLVPVTDVEEIKEPIEIAGNKLRDNIRKDYGDIELLAKQIMENGGIRIPCRGFKKGAKYYLTDGHRRYRAAKLILEKYGEIIDIPIVSEQGITEEKRIMDMIICNEGKPLNPVEQAEAVHRLIECELSEKEIMEKTGFSNVYICNLKMLQKAPNKIKDLISKNVISATFAMSIMRKEKDFDKAIESIENAIEFKRQQVSESGNDSSVEVEVKVTERDLRKSKKKVNSISCLKKAYRHFEKHELTVREDKIELFTFVSRLIDGDISYDELMATFYEPKVEKNK